MSRNTSSNRQFIGVWPVRRYVLLRNGKQIEVWTPIDDPSVTTRPVIYYGDQWLEYVKTAAAVYRVPDTPFNRAHHFKEIGRIYVDERPRGAEVWEL